MQRNLPRIRFFRLLPLLISSEILCYSFFMNPPESKAREIFLKEAENLLSGMTLEEKVGQLFMVGGLWESPESVRVIEKYHFGNVFLAKSDVNPLTPDEVLTLTNRLQKIALENNNGIPLLISTDQEGGRVNRLKNGFVEFPDQETIGKKASLKEATELGFYTGEQLRAVGVHVNFAPVLDIQKNTKSHIAREKRSFSSDPLRVAELAQAYIFGHRQARVIACIKHFPGYGEVTLDPHQALPQHTSSKKELLQTTIFPYIWLKNNPLPTEPHIISNSSSPLHFKDSFLPLAIKKSLTLLSFNNNWDMIMTGHIEVPALESKSGIPATLSQDILQNYLRGELGYTGVIVTDDLNMGAIQVGKDPGRIAREAINAGGDLLLFVGDEKSQIKAWESLVDTFRKAEMPLTRLNESVLRILSLKLRFISFPDPYPDQENIALHVNTARQRELNDKLRK